MMDADFDRRAFAILHAVDEAMGRHVEWLHRVHRWLLSDAAPPPRGPGPDQSCLGAWAAPGAGDLGHDPGLAEIEQSYRAMHAAAARLLDTRATGAAISARDYDAFSEVAITFKRRVRSFQRRAMDRVCGLDYLTGVWNRHAMHLRLAEEVERLRRGAPPCALSMMDVDYFKRINDRYGHLAGDAVLRALATAMAGRLRRSDSVFRYGGEEFLLCLPNTGLDAAVALIQRLRHDLADLAIPVGADTVQVTASFGVSDLDPQLTIDQNVARADRALLAAKREGRDRVCTWQPDGCRSGRR